MLPIFTFQKPRDIAHHDETSVQLHQLRAWLSISVELVTWQHWSILHDFYLWNDIRLLNGQRFVTYSAFGTVLVSPRLPPDAVSPGPVAELCGQTCGTDAAGIIDFLKLLGGSLVRLFRWHAAREPEMAFLCQHCFVLKRSAPVRLARSEPRSSSSPRFWSAGIGAAFVFTGAGSRAVVSADLRSRPRSVIRSGQ